MTRIMFFVLLLVNSASLSGCVDAGENKVKLKNCYAIYKSGAGINTALTTLEITGVRYDRFGRMYLRPKSSLKIKFYSTWVLETHFYSNTCGANRWNTV